MEKQKPAFNALYKFRNGNIVEFTIQMPPNPISKCEWGKMDKKSMPPLNEYVKECIPFIYQKAADYFEQTILWVDPTGHYLPQSFEPGIKISCN